MKTFSIFFIAFLPLAANQLSAQTAKLPDYPLRFEFRAKNGMSRDTVLPPFMFKVWTKSSDYPDYVKWKNLPFAILKTKSGFGLFTDSATTFSAGDTIGYAFYKKPKTIGKFGADYIKTNLSSFANDSPDFNMEFVITPKGIALIAKGKIASLSELTFNKQQLFNMFPEDNTAKAMSNFKIK